MGPRPSPSADTTFLFVGFIFNCCWRDLKNLDEMAFMEAAVSNQAVVFDLPI